MQYRKTRSLRKMLTAAALVALAGAAPAAIAEANEGIRPDATMLRFPDISKTHIVFAYANDLWIVDRTGGVATPLASPQGAEAFPKFSPDGKTVAFNPNYESGRDI